MPIVMLIIKSLILHSPIMQTWKIQVPHMIEIRCAEKHSWKLLEELRIFRTRVLQRTATRDEIIKKLVQRCDPVVIIYCGKQSDDRLLEEVVRVMTLLKANNATYINIPVIIRTNSQQLSYTECVFGMDYEQDSKTTDLDILQLVPNPTELAQIKLRCTALNESFEYSIAIRAAFEFLRPGLERCASPETILMCEKVASMLPERAENAKDANGLERAFIALIYEWVKEKNSIECRQLPELMPEDQEKYDEVLFYDRSFIYLSETLFKRIAVPVLEKVDISFLKRHLREVGVIVSEPTSQRFVVKMTSRVKGNLFRPWMIRLSREHLDITGELDILELIKNRKGGDYSDT